MSDIIDDIDELVNWQLDQYDNRSGYDHNVRQVDCWHCGTEWHGIKITARIARMRRYGVMDEGYRLLEDDSEVLCPGPDFIGPWATPGQLRRMRVRQEWEALRDSVGVPQSFASGGSVQISHDNGGSWSTLGGITGPIRFTEPESGEPIITRLAEGFRQMSISFTVSMEGFRDSITALSAHMPDATPIEESPRERALPRPSTTPPMWANDPSRQRRSRTRRSA